MSVDGADTFDVVIIGGCGHVGLPLGIALADRGARVGLYDINAASVKLVNDATMPFREAGAEAPLARVTADGRLVASTDPAVIGRADIVVVVVGTPVDEYLSPDPQAIPRAIRDIGDRFADGQLIVLRSTVYPGVTQLVERAVRELGVDVEVAFCPERIAEGRAMVELFELPQIVAARTQSARDRAEALFRRLTDSIVHLEPEEAELAKLFTNTWRYIKFATANQFYMIANNAGLDFEKIRAALSFGYPRATDLPGPGFAAGPCLFKDTMQLAAFNNNNFVIGHTAMLINEGLPLYLVSKLEQQFDLPKMTVGVLGMAFKGGSDDSRESLAYKLRKILMLKAADTLCTDPYINDPRFVPLDDVLTKADLLVIAAPHPEYRDLVTDKPVADMWGIAGRGMRI